MNELSLQGKIYVVCQFIYFLMILYGIKILIRIEKKLEK